MLSTCRSRGDGDGGVAIRRSWEPEKVQFWESQDRKKAKKIVVAEMCCSLGIASHLLPKKKKTAVPGRFLGVCRSLLGEQNNFWLGSKAKSRVPHLFSACPVAEKRMFLKCIGNNTSD